MASQLVFFANTATLTAARRSIMPSASFGFYGAAIGTVIATLLGHRMVFPHAQTDRTAAGFPCLGITLETFAL